MRVTRLPKDPGPAGWNRLLPDPPPSQSLEGDVSADWLVIWAGFAGLAAARRLTQLRPDDRIVMLDATRIGDGPAGRNSGFMIDLPHDLASDDYAGGADGDLAQIRANRHGISFAGDMARDFDLPAEAFRRSGKVNAAATDRGAQANWAYAAHLAELGEISEAFDATQMQALTGSSYYKSGLFTPGCAVIQPAMFVRGVADGLRGLGVLIHENSAVTDLTWGAGWEATTAGGRVSAPKVILAVNGHANSFGLYSGRLIHVFTYASMTRALSGDEVARLGGQAVWGVTPADPLGSTVRRISGVGGDRIVVRNRFTFDPTMQVPDGRIMWVAQDHDRAFAARFPMLAGVEMEHRWGGRLCLSRNGAWAFGEVEQGLYSACCQNGLGTAKGTFAGAMVAELATGAGDDMLDWMQAQAGPSKLPPAPLTRVGATLKIAMGERRAGAEL